MSVHSSVLIALVAFCSLALCQEKPAPHFLMGPVYLANLTKEEKQDYYKIIGDQDLTVKKQEEQKLAFAEKHGFAQAIKDDMKVKHENHERVRKERPEIIKNLLAAHEELMKIYDNKDQTRTQIEQAVDALRKKYPHTPATLYYIARLITGHGPHKRRGPRH